MSWLKAGLSLVLAACLTLFPVTVTKAGTPWTQELVTSLGCAATVTSIDSSGFNAYYSPMSDEIVLIGFNNIPESWQRLILLHETGHCIQWQNGEMPRLLARGPYEIEWDADAYAIRQLDAVYGIDGAALNAEIWGQLYRQFGYKGDIDDSHGTSVGRITRGNLNRVAPRIES